MSIKREIWKRSLPLLMAVCCVCGLLVAAAPRARAWSSEEEFQAYALANWSRPLLADTQPVTGGGRFGTTRNGRTHAAVDIGVTDGEGTPVYAMADGVVMEYCKDFYYGTSSVGVKNTDGSVLRYCEISSSLRNGDTVTQGQVIGTLTTNSFDGTDMLHLELYLGTREGSLTERDNADEYDFVPSGNYLRRADLLDPTFLLKITRFNGEHDHVWNGDGLCKFCGQFWKDSVDPALYAGFLDVTAEDYCYDAVLWAVDKGVSSGSGSAYFGTYTSCTRAQAVTMLWRAAGSPETGAPNPFTDVSESDYCYDAVRWAYAAGISGGTGDGLFDPEGEITRAQAVLFLWRAAGSPAQKGNVFFTDIDGWDSYHDAIEWATVNGIAGGTGPATFGPSEACIRGQLVTFLYRAYAAGTEI